MKFWKEHVALRLVLMLVTFVLGAVLLVMGWGAFDKMLPWVMTGKLSGLITMLVGVGFLLGTLSLYNKPFEEPKTKKSKVK